ncbi:hypothetical protein ZHAS_00009803 [Anopheles sinensis]|uniref:Uncharacterized protein n=1 Tax=Anopheles sinensis TaxID=74873 RepID=A0A084VVZ6_ANOSI|nr:hypothetical protein ZHAS_00009803 [Anopheles sinensis]
MFVNGRSHTGAKNVRLEHRPLPEDEVHRTIPMAIREQQQLQQKQHQQRFEP